MIRPRVIPCLLLKNRVLVKTVKFKDPIYVGDPLNAIKIFNEKGVDELILLDITATVKGLLPDFDMIAKLAEECFMPVCYGGGIRTVDTIRKIFRSGIEKVSIGSYAVENPSFIKEAAAEFGNQSIVVCIDVKKNSLNRYRVVTRNGRRMTDIDPFEYAVKIAEMGAGELLINSIDRDGTMMGYDIGLINKITDSITIPVIASGGAGKMEDIYEVITKGGASSAAAGSLFVFYGRLRAVLINYPNMDELEKIYPKETKKTISQAGN